MCVHIFDPGPCIDFSTELGMQADCEASTGHGTGNSPLLNKWWKRCAKYGNNNDEIKLINLLAKELHVKMRKNGVRASVQVSIIRGRREGMCKKVLSFQSQQSWFAFRYTPGETK